MNIRGVVEIKPRGTLADVASILGGAWGIEFVPETTGRYEEYPAYYADVLGLHLALLGVPEPEEDIRDEPTTNFTLQVWGSAGTQEEEINISSFLAAGIKSRANLECRAVPATDNPALS